MRLTYYDRDLINLIQAAKGDRQTVSYNRDLRYYQVLWWSRQPHVAQALAARLAETKNTPPQSLCPPHHARTQTNRPINPRASSRRAPPPRYHDPSPSCRTIACASICIPHPIPASAGFSEAHSRIQNPTPRRYTTP